LITKHKVKLKLNNKVLDKMTCKNNPGIWLYDFKRFMDVITLA
jgi:hypothetical protein